MTAAGLIFSNIHDDSLSELTRMRTMASVPFGGRYRLIDFALSAMVNADISKVGISTSNNYRSLVDHLGTGKDWDLARRSAGIKILPPNITAYAGGARPVGGATRLDAMIGALNFVERCTEDVIVMSDCDAICSIDLGEVLRFHAENRADVTVVTKHMENTEKISARNSVIDFGEDFRITDVRAFSANEDGAVEISTNIMIANREYLLSRLYDASARGYTSFFRDIMSRRADLDRFFAFRFDGYYSFVNSIRSYYDCSMELLKPEVRKELFGSERPVYTKVRNSAPTRYLEGSCVSNSLIADGCVIEGTVENSVIFRGVHVGKGSVVKNCILMQDAYIGGNVELNCVITDKNAVLRDGCELSGHAAMPFFIGKGVML